MAWIRLDKFLASNGCGSRREVKQQLKKGLVTVNGVPAVKPEQKVDPEQDQVCVAGRLLSGAEFVWLMLHKPAGCVTATSDRTCQTVLDYIDHPRKKQLFPVGRLDIDTEGLLLLTNDGATAHRLLSPRHHVKKTYFVRTEGAVTVEDAQAFSQGIDIGDEKITLPAELRILRSGVVSESELTICEGRFHQVKRMFAARGSQVCYLKRTAMGGVKLDERLAPGQWRELTMEETERLLSC